MYRVIILGLIALIGFTAQSALAQSIGTPARHAILIDATAGEVLFEKGADEPIPPASMSKLMTVFMAFDAIKNEELRLDDTVYVSDEAWRQWNNRGSTMFLRARDEVTVLDLLRGIIVLSGNDACVVLAEHMAGSHELFVEWMNAKAVEIGLTGSTFKNANGWPEEGHVMSTRDIATVSQLLATGFPELYPLFAEREFQYKNFSSNRFNRNPILGSFPGADGLKTGHTEEAGYGLAASAIREGRRLVLVVAGLGSTQERSRESKRLLQTGYLNYDHYPLFKAGETVDFADVWLGDEATIQMTLAEDLNLVLSRSQRAKMVVKIQFVSPIAAPITKGQSLGNLVIELPDRENISVPLIAGKAVGEVSGIGRLGAALDYFLFGSAGSANNGSNR